MHQLPVKATAMTWSTPDHNKVIFLDYNGLVGSVSPLNNEFEWDVSDADGKNIDAGTETTLAEAKKIVETVIKQSKGTSKCRSCGKRTDESGLCDKCYKSEATAKTKKSAPAVSFTEGELDTLLSTHAIDQEVKKMLAKGVLPSQRVTTTQVVADVTEAVRWQEAKEKELADLKTSDAKGEMPWVQDITEDFVTYGLSPANTKEEAKIILENLDKDLAAQAEAGFGPDARNYIVALRKELELLIEKL